VAAKLIEYANPTVPFINAEPVAMVSGGGKGVEVKLAATLAAPFMVNVRGLVVPVNAPLKPAKV